MEGRNAAVKDAPTTGGPCVLVRMDGRSLAFRLGMALLPAHVLRDMNFDPQFNPTYSPL